MIDPTASLERLEERIAPAIVGGVLSIDDKGETLIHEGASGVGDVNGDGIDDYVSVFREDPSLPFGKTPLNAILVFGAKGLRPEAIDVYDSESLRATKFVIGQFSYIGAFELGDINGDGFDDIVFSKGILAKDPVGYVVYGRPDFDEITDLSKLNSKTGFVLNAKDNLEVLKGVGDVNGDGVDDFAASFTTGYTSGITNVIFGRKEGFGSSLDLKNLNGTNGFTIAGGYTEFAGGDFNGDGISDILIGNPQYWLDSPREKTDGVAWLVYGKASPRPAEINLEQLDAADGFRIRNTTKTGHFGLSVATGDVNGDGYADLVISGQTGAVIYGTSETMPGIVDLLDLDGTVGTKIVSPRGWGRLHISDINGDGCDDLVSEMGTVFYGRPKGFGNSIDAYHPGVADGFFVNEFLKKNQFAFAVKPLADVDGDGKDDFVLLDYQSPYPYSSFIIYGLDTRVSFSPDMRSAFLLDTDGDVVTVKTSKGVLDSSLFSFDSQDGLFSLNLADSQFAGTGITISAKTPKGGTGDGMANVAGISATGMDLGKVSVSGHLGWISAGDGDAAKPALAALTVGTLGSATQPSMIDGNAGKISVKGDLTGSLDIHGNLAGLSIGGDIDGSGNQALVRASGDIKSVSVKGSILAGNADGGIAAGGRLGSVKIGGDLMGGPSGNAVLSAGGVLDPGKASDAIAIKNIAILGNVMNSLILSGYDTSLAPVNHSASIGKITVNGNWQSASIAAGIADVTHDGFGRNDSPIPGDSDLGSRIASIAIKGSLAGGNSFHGITAGTIGTMKAGKEKIALAPGADAISLDPSAANFFLMDFA